MTKQSKLLIVALSFPLIIMFCLALLNISGKFVTGPKYNLLFKIKASKQHAISSSAKGGLGAPPDEEENFLPDNDKSNPYILDEQDSYFIYDVKSNKLAPIKWEQVAYQLDLIKVHKMEGIYYYSIHYDPYYKIIHPWDLRGIFIRDASHHSKTLISSSEKAFDFNIDLRKKVTQLENKGLIFLGWVLKI